ncbi:TPA: rhodanese-related sulfurtransferase [Streptococcus pyogenes]|nr:rhodanese-related sulfurtransferase [Streptococcus pyogenes]
MSEKIRVLLYYKYVSIENAQEYAAKHLEFCKSIGLKGRILIADEGINGTVSGDYETTQKYMDWVHSDERFADLWFKIDEENQQAFRKMFVRYKKEIVHLGLEDNNFDSDINPLETTGEYLNPKQFKEALLDEDTVVLDTRNDYEYDLGHFRGAIRPDIRNFRELPQWVRDNKDKFMEKRVVVYCTGGVRCEKFSGWMVREGFKDVGQLHGGIATYGKDPEVQGELWDGTMYVFDDRISVPINHVNPTVISKDYFDGTPCERYVNCANPFCNKQIFASEENETKYVRGCSPECRAHERNRYVQENGLSRQEWAERLEAIGESLPEFVGA